jgi:hypothetical protein
MAAIVRRPSQTADFSDSGWQENATLFATWSKIAVSAITAISIMVSIGPET